MLFLQSLNTLSAKDLVMFPVNMFLINSWLDSIVSVWNIINLFTASLSRYLKICKSRSRSFITSCLSHGLRYSALQLPFLR